MDFGKVTIPTKWEDITLKQFCELMRVYDKDDKDILDVLEVLSGRTKSELRQMPADFIDTMMQHLQFMNIPLNVEADSKIVINGEEYKVNYTDKLKFGEWTDAETVLKEKDYAGVLAILARKDGEIYDDDFIANELDKRIELFNSLSITKALVLLNFFLKLKLNSILYSQKSLENSKEAIESLVQCIKSSLKDGGGNMFSTLSARIKLRRLEKQLRCI